MDAVDGCVVVCLPGWMESKGVQSEIRWFRNAGKSIDYFVPFIYGHKGFRHLHPRHDGYQLLEHPDFLKEYRENTLR